MHLASSRPAGRPASTLRPSYRSLADEFRRRMLEGIWKRQAVLPSLRTLAREHGVGLDTVREAVDLLKQEGRIARNAHRRLVVSDIQRFPCTFQRTVLEVHSDSLDASWTSSSYAAELQRGLEVAAGKAHAPLLIAHSHMLRQSLPHDFLDLPLKGILLPGHFEPAVLAQYERLSTPAVLYDQPPAGHRLHSVCVDNEEAARDATARLLALGHRRIAYLGSVLFSFGGVDPDSRERQQGFLKALRGAGLHANRNWVFNSFRNNTPQSPVIQNIAHPKHGFTAIVAVDEVCAELAANAAVLRGRKIPQDLSLVCFQGLSGTCRFSGPSVDFEALGRQAFALLADAPAKAQVRRVGTTWVERGTVAPPP